MTAPRACGADGRHWQSWHLRFPHYEERFARMSAHVRTEEFAAEVAGLRLCAVGGVERAELRG